jgi:hypothetical protein
MGKEEKPKLNPADHLENAMVNASDDSVGDLWLAQASMLDILTSEVKKRNGLKGEVSMTTLKKYASAMSADLPQWWREVNCA